MGTLAGWQEFHVVPPVFPWARRSRQRKTGQLTSRHAASVWMPGSLNKERENVMEDKAIIIIVVSGNNIMGDALCTMEGMVRQKGKKVRNLSYQGPVTSALDVADAISEIFAEPDEEQT